MTSTTRRRRTIGFLTATAVVVVGMVMPTVAWARYRATGAETNTVATHILLAPGQPTCGTINLFTVPLSWTAPSDAAYVLSYELGTASAPGGPYTYTSIAGTSTTVSIPVLTTKYFVVRTVNHQWRGPNSPERPVFGGALVAIC